MDEEGYDKGKHIPYKVGKRIFCVKNSKKREKSVFS
jgi:hypothetical protein